jgi:hypothetical protein
MWLLILFETRRKGFNFNFLIEIMVEIDNVYFWLWVDMEFCWFFEDLGTCQDC